MIRIRRAPDVQTFLADAGLFLAEREAEHNLLLGICAQLARTPERSGSDPAYFAVGADGDRIVGAAIRTPPHNLVLSQVDDLGLIEPLIRDVHDANGRIPGVLGPKDAVAVFARSWSDRLGTTARLSVAERIYRASSVRSPVQITGILRPYRDDDHDLTIQWLNAFIHEALPEEMTDDAAEEVLRRRLGDPDGGIRLWEVAGRAVSLAAFGSKTPNGIRVGPVYTPPEFRRHGYASALVADMTIALLAAGNRFCFLFTDLSNTTSNGVYQRIGYEAVSDVDLYAFDHAS